MIKFDKKLVKNFHKNSDIEYILKIDVEYTKNLYD